MTLTLVHKKLYYGLDSIETVVPNESIRVGTETVAVVKESEKCLPVNENQVRKLFQERNIAAVVHKPKRKFEPPFLGGSLMKMYNQEILQISAKQTR